MLIIMVLTTEEKVFIIEHYFRSYGVGRQNGPSLHHVRPGADQSSKAAFGKSAFAKTCCVLLKIRLAHINQANSKNAFEQVLAESILLVARAEMCS